MSENLSKKRIISYDIIRCIAIMAVVMIHSSARFVERFEPDTTNFLLGNLFNGISRLGVPLFVMLSGALMLRDGRDCSIKSMCKQALNIGILLFIWSFMYAAAYEIAIPLMKSEVVSLIDFFHAIIFGNYHLWYLYMIIGLYLITPILKGFVKKENANLVLWFILLSVAFEFSITSLNYVVSTFTSFDDTIQKFVDSFKLDFVCQFVSYYLTGWYITNVEIKKKHRTILYAAGIASLVYTIVGCAFFTRFDNEANKILYSNLSLNVFLYSVSVFTFIYYAFKDKEIKYGKKAIVSLSKYSFGIYLIHEVFIKLAVEIFGVDNALLQIPLFWIIVFSISLLATLIISKIPVLKKLVRG